MGVVVVVVVVTEWVFGQVGKVKTLWVGSGQTNETGPRTQSIGSVARVGLWNLDRDVRQGGGALGRLSRGLQLQV